MFTKAKSWTLFSTRWNTTHFQCPLYPCLRINFSLSLSLTLSNDISSGLRCTIFMHCSCPLSILQVPSISFFDIHSDSIYWSVYVMKVLIIESLDSSDGVVTTLRAGRLGNLGSISSAGNTFFSFSKCPFRLWVRNQCLNQWLPRHFLGVKVAGAWS
jgi:hypothetical protein